MTAWTDSAQPALSTMYRLQWEETQQCHVLLFPEGMVRLNMPAAEILRRCDGRTAVADLVADLERTFGEADLHADVLEFLEQARGRHWIR
ncbi:MULTISPECIES: pyrroloquinoline quinone biosynthesis peptide chaperone PqqD [Variovorax]|jgi:pyrroloquinoline quinone biosynthesis protein D|uniref:pyrroloquinoline quinone biosynthesis peptide chaperone PqqD n=1 Tax=Variovorax TaxID=34072 RepID=UPI0003702941|nr:MULTISPECIES: pyrroloquinoline quinone biosynthesis peptide chaperone PqqD [Variovorax]MBB3641757.1 pyrroloquinoline quinone biosynthesis protein D [Variovorax sp. BK613]MDR6520776.1 pyrroloquinoline quinone biosynthesis protein D [Variovorax paradoxus]